MRGKNERSQRGKSNAGPAILITSVVLIILVVVSGIMLVRKNRREATTAREFIEKYSAAYDREDVDTILKMRAKRAARRDAGVDPDSRKAMAEYSEDKEREEVEQDISRRGFEYQAWKRARYVGERADGGHLRVEIEIEGARTEVVLVREGDILKITMTEETMNDERCL